MSTKHFVNYFLTGSPQEGPGQGRVGSLRRRGHGADFIFLLIAMSAAIQQIKISIQLEFFCLIGVFRSEILVFVRMS